MKLFVIGAKGIHRFVKYMLNKYKDCQIEFNNDNSNSYSHVIYDLENTSFAFKTIKDKAYPILEYISDLEIIDNNCQKNVMTISQLFS